MAKKVETTKPKTTEKLTKSTKPKSKIVVDKKALVKEEVVEKKKPTLKKEVTKKVLPKTKNAVIAKKQTKPKVAVVAKALKKEVAKNVLPKTKNTVIAKKQTKPKVVVVAKTIKKDLPKVAKKIVQPKQKATTENKQISVIENIKKGAKDFFDLVLGKNKVEKTTKSTIAKTTKKEAKKTVSKTIITKAKASKSAVGKEKVLKKTASIKPISATKKVATKVVKPTVKKDKVKKVVVAKIKVPKPKKPVVKKEKKEKKEKIPKEKKRIDLVPKVLDELKLKKINDAKLISELPKKDLPNIATIPTDVKKVKSILISQPKPENGKSQYLDIGNEYKIKVDYRPFTHVEGIKAIEFRKQKIYLEQYTCIIFTSRNAIEQYFRICEEMRIKISDSNLYFCQNEAIALYLQKFIQYRKRKVFFGDGKLPKLMEVILKQNEAKKFLLPCSDTRDQALINALQQIKIDFTEAIIFKTVASDLSDLSDVKYDMLVFFNSSAIDSLYSNFPTFTQDETRLAIFGNHTADAVKTHNLKINVFAPTPENPSLVDAIKKYLKLSNKK